jgi:hypothetical protein
MLLAATGAASPAFAERGGVKLFLKNAVHLDLAANTVTLPVFRGRTPTGGDTWYIVTESSDRGDARRRGVNFAPKLANALGTAAVQQVRVLGAGPGNSLRHFGIVQFAGTVDFSPTRVVVPNPVNGFPPDAFAPGAVGDAAYSPLITTGDGIVLNASQVANASGRHDSLVSLDLSARTVTLKMLSGFYEGDPIVYLRTDASLPLLAAIEASTFAPNMNAAPGIASNDEDTSARSAIIPIVNGPRGIHNPERQGLESALLGEGDPLNITQEIPDDDAYSPMWDVHPAVWTDAAIAAGQRRRLTDHSAWVPRTSPWKGCGPRGSSPTVRWWH